MSNESEPGPKDVLYQELDTTLPGVEVLEVIKGTNPWLEAQQHPGFRQQSADEGGVWNQDGAYYVSDCERFATLLRSPTNQRIWMTWVVFRGHVVNKGMHPTRDAAIRAITWPVVLAPLSDEQHARLRREAGLD